MSEVKRLNFTISQFESVVPYASEHGQYVRYTDYAKLDAEAQALREEVAALKHSRQALIGSRNAHRDERDAALKEVAALRARVVVVPERLTNGDSISRMLREIGCDGDVSYHHAREIWNACLDGLERLNGKTVSKGLLRRIVTPALTSSDAQDRIGALEELRALLSEQDGGKP
ncbi:hypothetical protein [Pseudomonas aeruginosa]|uniref:hypothetical protein n=1 Tax=Pseudomonas aeruginosa TaxID=287 RepID=UPI000FC3FD8A|nr:hypothetical protein [Pseudomonas aeruginosa]RUF08364.1 hypothetical protein IPC1134_06165 [Pseudomonas aeruginosa]